MNQRAYYHKLGEAAAAKCLSCRHHKYRPYIPSPSGRYRHVAFQPAAVKCEEGIHSMMRKNDHAPFFTAIHMMKSSRSQVRREIMACAYWEPALSRDD